MNDKFSEDSVKIIKKIADCEGIDLNTMIDNFTEFHKNIKKRIRHYKTRDGLTDYKLKCHDLLILLYLYKNTNPFDNKIELILVIMYSYYKLDDFHFPTSMFNIAKLFIFLSENENIHYLMYQAVTNKEFLIKIKRDL